MEILHSNTHNSLDIYGPRLWEFIHILSFGDYSVFKMLLFSLQGLIPCLVCRKHFKLNCEEFLPNCYEDFGFEWTYILHDRVNQSKGVKSPDYIQCYDMYKSKWENLNKTFYKTMFFVWFTLTYDIENLIDFNTFITASYLLISQKINTAELKELMIKHNIMDYTDMTKWVYILYSNLIKTPFPERKIRYFFL